MLINPNAPQYEGKLEYSASNFNMKLDSSIIVQGIIDVKGMISGEYQMENQLKQTVEIGFEQAFQVSLKTMILLFRLLFSLIKKKKLFSSL